MAKVPFKSMSGVVISTLISPIIRWVKKRKNSNAFFFLVIGDKNCTDVAWYNTEDLSCDGALAITARLESVAAFQDLAGSVDILNEDNLKNDDFRKKFELTSPSMDSMGWDRYENIVGGVAYTEKQAKKGGKQ